MNCQGQTPLFTRFEIVHGGQLNMERNVYWTNFHALFADALEEFLIYLEPDLRERFISGELQIFTFDTYIEHNLSAFLYENLCINLSIGEINTRESLVKILVTYTFFALLFLTALTIPWVIKWLRQLV